MPGTRNLLSRFFPQPARPAGSVIVSYPKSGQTWLRFMLAQAMCLKFDLDEPATVEIQEICAKHPEIPSVSQTHYCGAILYENGERPDPHQVFRQSRVTDFRQHHVVLLVRDPRDVVVSYFHQVTKRSRKPMEFESLSDFVRDPIYGIDRIIAFNNLIEANQHRYASYRRLRYEDLHRNTGQTFSELLDFLGLSLPSPQIENIIENSRADSMRKLEQQGEIEGMRQFGRETNTLKVRKAKIGSFRDELSPEDIDYCNDRLKRLRPELHQIVESD